MKLILNGNGVVELRESSLSFALGWLALWVYMPGARNALQLPASRLQLAWNVHQTEIAANQGSH